MRRGSEKSRGGNKAVERWGPGRARALCVCKPPLAEPRWLTGGLAAEGRGCLAPSALGSNRFGMT